MIVVGLTGSIGMGKSTVAAMFADEGAPVFSADDAVHALYAPGGAAAAAVEQAFPGVARDGAIDRAVLSARVIGRPDAMKRLEEIVHPLVQEARVRFLRDQKAAGADLVVLDIPLLLEGEGAAGVDQIIVVSAPAEAQRARVLARPGMSADKFERILARQMPDAEKRARADFVIETGGALEATRARVKAVLDALREQI